MQQTWPPLASAELYTPASIIPAPVLFSLSGDGKGQGAIWHSTTGAVVSASDPAIAGEALSMYTANLAAGGVIPPQVIVGGRLAKVLYFGPAPGYSGYDQVNFVESEGIAPGPFVSVRLTYLGRPSNEVTIGSAVMLGGGGVFKSTDGGTTWDQIDDGLPNLDIRELAVSADGSGAVYASTPGGVFRWVDRNQNARRPTHGRKLFKEER